MTTGTIRLSYGNFTCSFDRIAEEDVFTRAIIAQIAEIVSRNPSFGAQDTASGVPPMPPSPRGPTDLAHFRASATAPTAGQNPMRLENPVAGPVAISVSEAAALDGRDFDSAHNDDRVEFMRSANTKSHTAHVADNAALIEKYETLRAAVLRMLDESSEALDLPVQQAPAHPKPVLRQMPAQQEEQQRSVARHGSTLRIFPMPR
jgi:hypothetical protein